MAITFVVSTQQQTSATSTSFSLGHTVAVNNLLVVMMYYTNGATSQNSPTVSDNINSGNYSAPASLSFFNSGTSTQMTFAYIVCNAAGTPTISITGLNGTSFVAADAVLYSGWAATPTLVTADISCKFGTGTAVSSTNFNNSNANELIMGYIGHGGAGAASAFTGTVSTARDTNNGNNEYLDTIKSSSGNSMSLGCTMSTSVNWATMLAGFADISSVVPYPRFSVGGMNVQVAQ